MAAPSAFISYSHDSAEHSAWVLRLASELRAQGINVVLDQWDLSPGGDTVAFMEKSIADADRVLLICTSKYVEKANDGEGGVGYEKLVITGELVSRIDTKKFIPLTRQETIPRIVPHYIGSRLYIDFSNDADFTARLEQLARELHGAPINAKPALGPNPFAGAVSAPALSSRRVESEGFTAGGESAVSDAWFTTRYNQASAGLRKLGRQGYMEVRASLYQPVAKSQLELLSAVRASQIRTFGWPIAILLENKEEYRPRPVADGIVAEIAIAEGKALSGSPSYDYWAARTNGDFFLQQSLFEDERGESMLYFNTRIVRVAEVFLFLAQFYKSIGVPDDAYASVRICHSGLQGRTLASAGPTRPIHERATVAEQSDGQVEDTVAGLSTNASKHVMAILQPLFVLFDFTSFNASIYEEIIEKFRNGHAT
jgi:hypothetical protein